MFNGVILAGLLGQLISFQFPVFMAALDRTDHSSITRDRYIDVISETISWRCKNEKIRRKKP